MVARYIGPQSVRANLKMAMEGAPAIAAVLDRLGACISNGPTRYGSALNPEGSNAAFFGAILVNPLDAAKNDHDVHGTGVRWAIAYEAASLLAAHVPSAKRNEVIGLARDDGARMLAGVREQMDLGIVPIPLGMLDVLENAQAKAGVDASLATGLLDRRPAQGDATAAAIAAASWNRMANNASGGCPAWVGPAAFDYWSSALALALAADARERGLPCKDEAGLERSVLGAVIAAHTYTDWRRQMRQLLPASVETAQQALESAADHLLEQVSNGREAWEYIKAAIDVAEAETRNDLVAAAVMDSLQRGWMGKGFASAALELKQERRPLETAAGQNMAEALTSTVSGWLAREGMGAEDCQILFSAAAMHVARVTGWGAGFCPAEQTEVDDVVNCFGANPWLGDMLKLSLESSDDALRNEKLILRGGSGVSLELSRQIQENRWCGDQISRSGKNLAAVVASGMRGAGVDMDLLHGVVARTDGGGAEMLAAALPAAIEKRTELDLATRDNGLLQALSNVSLIHDTIGASFRVMVGNRLVGLRDSIDELQVKSAGLPNLLREAADRCLAERLMAELNHDAMRVPENVRAFRPGEADGVRLAIAYIETADPSLDTSRIRKAVDHDRTLDALASLGDSLVALGYGQTMPVTDMLDAAYLDSVVAVLSGDTKSLARAKSEPDPEVVEAFVTALTTDPDTGYACDRELTSFFGKVAMEASGIGGLEILDVPGLSMPTDEQMADPELLEFLRGTSGLISQLATPAERGSELVGDELDMELFGDEGTSLANAALAGQRMGSLLGGFGAERVGMSH